MEANSVSDLLYNKYGKKWHFITPDYAFGHTLDAVSPRTTAAVADRAPEPRKQTRDQRSASAQRTYRWRQWPQRDFEETPSRFATAASEVAPGISKPSIGRLRTRASKAHHEFGMRPTTGFPCSSAGSDPAGRDRSLAALPYFGISSARTPLIQCDAIAGWSPAEPPGPRQEGSARFASSI